MIEKTEAIALRITPFSNTSHIVTWLTPAGKVTTLFKGACRPKSMFLGQYDLFYTCELLYYTRDRNGLHIGRECRPVNSRGSLRRNWRSAVCASYICGLLSRLITERQCHRETYRHLTRALDRLAVADPTHDLLLWFEIRLLNLAGLGPQLAACPACRKPAEPDSDGAYTFSPSAGGMLCPECLARDSESGKSGDRVTCVSGDVYGMIVSSCASAGPPATDNGNARIKKLDDFAPAIGRFMEHHLDFRPPGREWILRVLRKPCHATRSSSVSSGT